MIVSKKKHHFLVIVALALLTVFAVSSCKKEKDPVIPVPVVDLSEVGSANSKQAYIGGDLHIEAQLEAEALIHKIEIEIHQEGGSYEFEKTYTEGKYIGVRSIEFHEHIDVPGDAPAGAYHLHLVVTDKNGNATTAESELQLVQKLPAAALVFTAVSGSGLHAHGDHFHGLGDVTEGDPVTVTFDEHGHALAHGHLHLEPEAVYKIELKTYDTEGKETQNQYIATQEVANQYKAFLVGGNFILNPDTENETGSIFQPREQQYADGTAVTGSGGVGTTGVLSYFAVGHDNAGPTKDVIFVLRKLNAGVKATITRKDWNRSDYATVFAGQNELELKFEIHAEDGHHH